ncbi:glycoside hydrolase family 3 protein [Glaciecola siphonariae]|uniref:beta-N-acetylhexosaminidase n=1 Tax=Glaciecola siphonariae TaxID=521012 RepID=A0ABV9LW64_9ALTE
MGEYTNAKRAILPVLPIPKRALTSFFALLITLLLCAASQANSNTVSLKTMVAQKLLIDLRYYCPAPDKTHSSAPTTPISKPKLCQQALTSLKPSLKHMLSTTQVGGVILFADNLQTPEQILRLTHDLQSATAGKTPLYIAIDQEGGRVTRLPNDAFFGFAGNMAIGATFAEHGIHYASKTAELMAQSLYALGFNLNFAPSLDVNSNPANPIINVRSFSERPDWVASLGAAQIKAFGQHNIAVAAKHFPGHGDTYVDSHVGLPRVERDLAQIERIDLVPFKYVIDNTDVDMIMTAHIQYPLVDQTQFSSLNGHSTELPATLSRTILTGLLRKKLGYKGLIVTDALDMAAISQFLSPVDAAYKAFKAGADIALMPFKISSAHEAEDFENFLSELSLMVASNPALKKEVEASYLRILRHKEKRKMNEHARLSLAEKQTRLNAWQAELAKDLQSPLASALSLDAMTQIKALPSVIKTNQSIYAVMPDKRRCQAIAHYLKVAGWQKYRCVSELSEEIDLSTDADLIIIGDIQPRLSFFESRQFEGITPNQRKSVPMQQEAIQRLVANSGQAQTILLKMRSPYVSASELALYSGIYASYDYQVAGEDDSLFAPVFDSFIKVLSGKAPAKGQAPVTVLSVK